MNGNVQEINEKYGVALLPTTYILSKSEEYSDLIESGKRSIYNEKEIYSNEKRI